ncbi:MAG: cell division protein FtsZ [Candidatus Pacebacteria bacterium]|nr:cell division protein FtsZ [Candidatus Paceibacterota bacterium]
MKKKNKKNEKKILKKRTGFSGKIKPQIRRKSESKVTRKGRKGKEEGEKRSFSSSRNINVKIVGVGGAGGNVVTRMREKRIEGVDFIAINTDIQGLQHTKADLKIQIGKELCKGLGAGMDPLRGKEAAEENIEEINQSLQGADMIFLSCGLGGGTGSGASPIVANLAKQAGALVVGVVTKPFTFEGEKRLEVADEAWQKLFNEVDALVTIPNDRVFNIVNEETPILEAFSKIDDILRQGVEAIVNLIAYPGLINLDFANIRTILSEAGSALLGIGISKGQDRAKKAAELAISSPLLDISIEGAKRVLFNVAGTKDMSLVEIHNAARVITQSIAKDAQVIFGASFDDDLRQGEIKVTVIAGGFGEEFRELRPVLPLEIKIPINKELNEKESEKEKEQEEQKEEFEIPAFLRRKNKAGGSS